MTPLQISLFERKKEIDRKHHDIPDKERLKKDSHLYFNYELRPSTWNLLVNKQLYMRFERLFIEKNACPCDGQRCQGLKDFDNVEICPE